MISEYMVEECLRKGLKALKAWDELYKKIYEHHYEIIRSEPSESKNAKLSLSNWILDTMSEYDFEPQEMPEDFDPLEIMRRLQADD